MDLINKLYIKVQQHLRPVPLHLGEEEQHLPPVHLDLFVVAVQLVGEEHQHPVHLDLSGMAVQLGGEENLLPVHLDFFVVAVQLSDEEHSPPVHLDLFVVSKEQNNLVITLQFYRLIIVHAEKRKGFKSSKKGEMLTGI
jgi:hypothetical protein